ncbi:restriction endonuclease [Acinetobacter sp. FL51]|jgi:hypothetical protein|uniref:restriction endonuclease n=1 Tax=Acinetobacter sp. FL51 TaxID=2777978 RepID=UPI0018E0F2E4|nr:restriction endonuclease [Acinetobacter sp. FL51]MBI1453450.1 restriction endonuclease [Acinetobacter sp. FL51]
MNDKINLSNIGNQARIGFRFQKLIMELLVKLGYINVKEEFLISGTKHTRADIILGELNNPEHPLCVVEIKAYRPSSMPSSSVINAALNQLQYLMKLAGTNKGMLIIATSLDSRFILGFNPNIEVWDLNVILNKAQPFPEIFNEFIDLFELDPKNKVILEQKKDSIGIELIEELKSIPKGKDGAYTFETWCIKILKYLFQDYLVGWKEQSSTIDGLHRRDLVCRVKDSHTEVWQFISHTLKSRYVIFEFKNYSEKITQREVFTTERYLFPMALRNCAFIISREGTSDSAQHVIDGAMREHGKLIISLSEIDISQLITGKEKGDDPNVYLFNKIDNFLIGLGR